MPKLTILVFESTLSFDADELKHLLNWRVEIHMSCQGIPTSELIKGTHERYSFFGIKAYYFNNSIPSLRCPEIVIFPEHMYDRARVFAENFQHKTVFVIPTGELEAKYKRVENFYIAKWDYVEEFIKRKLKGDNKDEESTSEHPKVHGRES